MARSVPRAKWVKYVELRENGVSRLEASRLAVIDFAAAQAFDRGDPRSSGHRVWLEKCDGKALWNQILREHISMVTGATGVSDEIDAEVADFKAARDVARINDNLPPEVKRVLADRTGKLFRERYFGRLVVPWQQRAWAAMRDMSEKGTATGDRQYLLVNCPPGVGKTTLLQDWACYRIVVNRGVRMGMFSIASSVAISNTYRVRKHLERTNNPVRAPRDEYDRGVAFNAVATLTMDFGAFKPATRELWTRQAFNVVQPDGETIDDKEPTLAAWGFDQSFIGQRLTDMLADDMTDRKITRNPDVLNNHRETWDREAEPRLNAGGLLCLFGQKLSPDDIYAYCERQTVPVWDDDDDLLVVDGEAEPRRYFHLKFPAHDDAGCTGVHKRREAKAWPDGCLLDPARLPWRELVGQQRKDPATYATVYQQSDDAPGSNLIEPVWIDGGIGDDGEIHLGCWDDERRPWTKPELPFTWGIGVITVDPSSTKWWAVQAWWYQQPMQPEAQVAYAGRRYLLGLENTKLDAPSLLGMNVDTREFYGLLEDMRQRYVQLGLHLDHVIIEANHAQRFLLQLRETHRWSEVFGITLHAHQTGIDKWDETVGVTILKDHYRHGRVRLPGGDRAHVKDLVRQLTQWGRITVTDQVMANWFLEKRLPTLPIRDLDGDGPTQHRPSWLLGRKTGAGGRRT